LSNHVVKRISKATEKNILKIQAVFARRGISISQAEIIDKAIRFVLLKLPEFFEYNTTKKKDGLKSFIENIVETGPESDCVAEHNEVN